MNKNPHGHVMTGQPEEKRVLAVVFQFRPYPHHRGTYFDLVAQLRPELFKIEGFLANERFVLPSDENALVSISLWQDEAAIQRWRAHAGHRVAQRRGKQEVFAGYRLRVGEAVEDGDDEDRLHVTIGKGLEPPSGADLYLSVLDPARQLVIDQADGEVERRLCLRVVRDYGPDAPA